MSGSIEMGWETCHFRIRAFQNFVRHLASRHAKGVPFSVEGIFERGTFSVNNGI